MDQALVYIDFLHSKITPLEVLCNRPQFRWKVKGSPGKTEQRDTFKGWHCFSYDTSIRVSYNTEAHNISVNVSEL